MPGCRTSELAGAHLREAGREPAGRAAASCRGLMPVVTREGSWHARWRATQRAHRGGGGRCPPRRGSRRAGAWQRCRCGSRARGRRSAPSWLRVLASAVARCRRSCTLLTAARAWARAMSHASATSGAPAAKASVCITLGHLRRDGSYARLRGHCGLEVISAVVKRLGAAAELPEELRHPHALRHTCATELLRAGGATIADVRALVRYASVKATSIYPSSGGERQGARRPAAGARPEPRSTPTATPHSRRALAVSRASLAAAGGPQRCRRAVRIPGPARPQHPRARRLADSPLPALARPRRHRPRGHRTHRDRVRDRDQDLPLRITSPAHRPRPGRLARAPAPTVVPRTARSPSSASPAPSTRAQRARRPRRLGRPPGCSPARTCEHERTPRLSGACRSADAPLSGAAARRRGWLPPQRPLRRRSLRSRPVPDSAVTRELALTPGVRSVSKPLRFRRESWTCLPRLA